MLIDEDDVRLDFALRAFERALNFRELPPARRLAVGDEVNLAAEGEPILERVDGLLQRGKNVRGTIREIKSDMVYCLNVSRPQFSQISANKANNLSSYYILIEA